MRLIDADKLKECAIACNIHNGTLTDLCVPLYQIDNAPTVEVNRIPVENLDFSSATEANSHYHRGDRQC